MAFYVTLGLMAAGLEAIFLATLLLRNLKAGVMEFILLALAGGILYLISVFAVLRIPPTRRMLNFIFAAGLVFRATLFPLFPSLSDDLYRYRWEGKAQVHGLNPYVVAPSDPKAAFLRDETYPAVNGKNFTTVYGPITELLLRGAYRIASLWPDRSSVLLMKLPALLFDLGIGLLLVRLLSLLGLPTTRALIYYWCPLAVVEFGASGHNDAVAVFFLLASIVAAETGAPRLSLTALAASACSKLFAAFLAPVLLVRAHWRDLLWPALLAMAVYFPFRGGLHNVLPGVAVYSGQWRNNDSLFGVIYLLAGSLPAASTVYLAIVAGTAGYMAGRRVPLLRSAYIILGTVLLFAANCFPWYLTWILPLLAVYVNPAWLLFTVTSVLAYHVLIPYEVLGLWQETSLFRILEYLPVYALLIAGWLWKRPARWNYR